MGSRKCPKCNHEGDKHDFFDVEIYERITQCPECEFIITKQTVDALFENQSLKDEIERLNKESEAQ